MHETRFRSLRLNRSPHTPQWIHTKVPRVPLTQREREIMLKGLLTKALARSDAVVKRGAKDAQKGKRTLPVDAFAQKGRNTKQKKS